jgi:hypothetical protein
MYGSWSAWLCSERQTDEGLVSIDPEYCHCEERSDEAISMIVRTCLRLPRRFAPRNDNVNWID